MSQYKPIEDCTSVRELLADPARWTKGYWAENAEGMRVDWSEYDAVCWCVDGALRRIYWHDGKYFEMADKLNIELDDPIWDFNDARGRTHAEVLAAVEKAGI